MAKLITMDYLIKKLMECQCMLRTCQRQFGNVYSRFDTPDGSVYVSVEELANEVKDLCTAYYTRKRNK